MRRDGGNQGVARDLVYRLLVRNLERELSFKAKGSLMLRFLQLPATLAGAVVRLLSLASSMPRRAPRLQNPL